jgi:opacity protein-like surface antigen
MRVALALAVLAVPATSSSLAIASPAITAGLSLGAIQSEVDAEGDHNNTLGLYGRLGFSKRIAGQLEVAKLSTGEYNYDNTTIRTATALLVVDLRDRGELMPVLMAGLGIDRASSDYDSTSGTHIEGGLGLEYRARSGLTIGLDFRLGGRSVDERVYEAYPVEGDVGGAPCGLETCVLANEAPSELREGEYRALRLSLGIRF